VVLTKIVVNDSIKNVPQTFGMPEKRQEAQSRSNPNFRFGNMSDLRQMFRSFIFL
jgi:hypothetical protein